MEKGKGKSDKKREKEKGQTEEIGQRIGKKKIRQGEILNTYE